MTTYPNIGLTLPTRGAPGAGLWGDTDDANYALLDAHDHSSGKGVSIKTAAISIDADLSFSSLYAPKDLQRITFASVAALSSNNKSLFVSNADNELYWRSNAGANVKLTAGSSLNVSAFTGGIGGDYTAVAASVQYDDANKRYTFKQGGGTTWARLQSGPLRLVELGTSETVFVEQAAPSALAASYTVTWPLALPAATRLMTVDNAGVMATVANAFVPPTLPAVKGALFIDSAGAVTATQTIFFSAVLASPQIVTSTINMSFNSNPASWDIGATTNILECPLILPVGSQVTALTAYIRKGTAATSTIECQLTDVNLATGAVAATTFLQQNSANAPGMITLGASGLTQSIASGHSYTLRIKESAATPGLGSDFVYGWSATL